MKITALVKQSLVSAVVPPDFDAAKRALRACLELDQVREWSNKMEGLVYYARKAKDRSLLDLARRIQAEAERRYGELLLEIPGSRGPSRRHTRAQAMRESGTPYAKGQRAIALARVPEEIYERETAKTPVPRVQQILWAYQPPISRRPSKLPSPFKFLVDFLEEVDDSDPKDVVEELPKEHLGWFREKAIRGQEWLDAFEQFLPKES